MKQRRTQKIPSTVRSQIGEARLEKGNWYFSRENGDLIPVRLWDFVEKCSGKDCPLYDVCLYDKNQDNICTLQAKYLRNVVTAMMYSIIDRKGGADEADMLKLGYHIMPLYNQLFKFKCWEYTNKELVYVSEKGTPKVHPVYKEIREIIKTVHQMWKDFSGDKKKVDPAKVGDESFIDAMFQEAGDDSPKDGGSDSDSDSDSEVSENGQAMDFGEEGSEENAEKGAGIDFGGLDTGKVEKMNRRGNIYRTPGTTKSRKRVKKKKKKPEPKKKVPGYCQSKNRYKNKNKDTESSDNVQSDEEASAQNRK